MADANPINLDIDLAAVQAAGTRLATHIRRTPCQPSRTLSAQLGLELALKFENLQFTASFKERGALNSLLQLGDAARQGVIAMSAGNHAQALAYHAQRLDIPATIVMPRSTPNAKVEATRVFGADIHLQGNDFDETRQFTENLAAERKLTLIHPFDDPHVIAGQGTVGLEILEQMPDLDALVVPVGGGGLIGGISLAVKSLRPDVEVIGVQMERYAGAHFARHGGQPAVTLAGTVAEGIAVKAPGVRNIALINEYVDRIELVSENAVEQAVFDFMEIEKTVVEGAGAVGLAWLRDHAGQLAGRRVVSVLSGGNIDMMILSSLLRRGLVRSNRLVRMRVEIPDMPGSLATLTTLIGKMDSNIMDIEHHRAFEGSSVRATVVELLLQMRGEEQLDNV
ncbi:MAG: threonine ammonia-lyase, partial [Pseudomonadota bacterium]